MKTGAPIKSPSRSQLQLAFLGNELILLSIIQLPFATRVFDSMMAFAAASSSVEAKSALTFDKAATTIRGGNSSSTFGVNFGL